MFRCRCERRRQEYFHRFFLVGDESASTQYSNDGFDRTVELSLRGLLLSIVLSELRCEIVESMHLVFESSEVQLDDCMHLLSPGSRLLRGCIRASAVGGRIHIRLEGGLEAIEMLFEIVQAVTQFHSPCRVVELDLSKVAIPALLCFQDLVKGMLLRDIACKWTFFLRISVGHQLHSSLVDDFAHQVVRH